MMRETWVFAVSGAEEQALGDLVVREALARPGASTSRLTLGEHRPGAPRRRHPSCRRAARSQQPTRHSGRQQRIAGCDHTDGPDELDRLGVFHQEPARAGADRLARRTRRVRRSSRSRRAGAARPGRRRSARSPTVRRRPASGCPAARHRTGVSRIASQQLLAAGCLHRRPRCRAPSPAARGSRRGRADWSSASATRITTRHAHGRRAVSASFRCRSAGTSATVSAPASSARSRMPRMPAPSARPGGRPVPSSVDPDHEHVAAVAGLLPERDPGAWSAPEWRTTFVSGLLHDAVRGRLHGARRQPPARAGRRGSPRGPRPVRCTASAAPGPRAAAAGSVAPCAAEASSPRRNDEHPADLVQSRRAEGPDVRERLARPRSGLACRTGAGRRRPARRSGSGSARARRAARGPCGCARPAQRSRRRSTSCAGARRRGQAKARGPRRPRSQAAMRDRGESRCGTDAPAGADESDRGYGDQPRRRRPRCSAHSRAPRTTAPMIANASARTAATRRAARTGRRSVSAGDHGHGWAWPAPRRQQGQRGCRCQRDADEGDSRRDVLPDRDADCSGHLDEERDEDRDVEGDRREAA